MNRRSFIQFIPISLSFTALSAFTSARRMKAGVQLIRHATLLIKLGNTKIMVDPMLSVKDAMDPVQNAANAFRNPMVDLPFAESALKKLLSEIDAVFVTHTHRDHWDAAAQQMIPKNIPVYCQPIDREKIIGQGFTNVTGIDDQTSFKDIKIFRTKGQHGTGEIGKRMGEVSGFVFQHEKHIVYVAGDTIWCDDVASALKTHQPNVTIVNAGAAQFLTGDPITMTPSDIIAVHSALPKTQIIAVHMDTINHCLVKRKDLKDAMEIAKIELYIPNDGEWRYLSK